MLSVILSCLLVMSAHAQKNTIVKLSYCDYACAAGENCVDTGIRCVRAPCPTYQCRGAAAMQQDSAHNIYERLAFLIAKLRGSPPPLSENTITKQQFTTQPQPQPTRQQQLQDFVPNRYPILSSSRSRNVRVVPDSYCSDKPCAFGEECIDTGLRCVRSPCPTFQCRRSTVISQDLAPYQIIPEQKQQQNSLGTGFSSNVPMLSQFGAPNPVSSAAYPPPTTNLVMESSNPSGQQFFKKEPLYKPSPDSVVAEIKPLTVVEKLELLKTKLKSSPTSSLSPSSSSFKRSDVVPSSYCGERCSSGEVCVESKLRCFRGPCPEVFKCVQGRTLQSSLDEKPACTRRCDPANGWHCGLERSCRRGECRYIQICNKARKP